MTGGVGNADLVVVCFFVIVFPPSDPIAVIIILYHDPRSGKNSQHTAGPWITIVNNQNGPNLPVPVVQGVRRGGSRTISPNKALRPKLKLKLKLKVRKAGIGNDQTRIR